MPVAAGLPPGRTPHAAPGHMALQILWHPKSKSHPSKCHPSASSGFEAGKEGKVFAPFCCHSLDFVAPQLAKAARGWICCLLLALRQITPFLTAVSPSLRDTVLPQHGDSCSHPFSVWVCFTLNHCGLNQRLA